MNFWKSHSVHEQHKNIEIMFALKTEWEKEMESTTLFFFFFVLKYYYSLGTMKNEVKNYMSKRIKRTQA